MDMIRLEKSTAEEVVIAIGGRLSSDNAPESEKLLFALREEHPEGLLCFDFEKLEYISSMGLRLLLKLAKREKQRIRILNVHPAVYGIMEEVGFVELFDTRKALQEFSLEGYQLIGKGTNGEVYRIDNEKIIKVFEPGASLEEVNREQRLSRQALIAGLPTAISFSVVRADDRYGIIFELIDADPLSLVLSGEPEHYEHFVDEYISLFHKIHQTEGNPKEFPLTKDIYRKAIRDCSEWYSEEELSKLYALLDSVPDRNTLIHGDYHPNNIMVQEGELLLIDMGDVGRGHPIFDFLATAATQVNLVKLNPDYAAMHTRMPPELITGTWRRLMDRYFADIDQERRNRIEEQICLFSKLKVALCPVFGRGVSEEILNASIQDAKANFIPRIEELMGAVDW